MTVSLSQVLASARARSAPLAGECAGYLVLAAADDAARGPRRIEAQSVELHADGSVRVVGGSPSDEATTERDLRDLLDELLLVAGSVTPALLRSARRRTGVGIEAFVREIETALIPVNRSAARRALSRLERETSRAVERGGLVIENQRVSDRAIPPEPPAAAPAPVPVPAPALPSETPPPVSLTPPPVSTSEAHIPAPVSSRPATDLLPTPVAVPVRPKILLEPCVDETPSKLETRPETVLARASQRPPERPSWPVLPPPKPEPRSLSRAPRASVAAAPCAPPPVESMTPFLGTATAQRAGLPPAGELDELDEFDVPIDVEVPVVAPAVAAKPEHVEAAEVAEEDIVEEAPDEFTEPFFLERDGTEEVGLAFHERTSLMAPVAPIEEPVIELAESPAPSAELLAEEVVVALPEVPELEVPEPEVRKPEVPEEVAAQPPEPPCDEFDDVELAVLLPSAEPPPVLMRRPASDPAALLPRRPLPQKRSSNVDDLLSSFGHDARDAGDEDDVRSTLKRLAGLEPTPPPPGAGRS